MLHSSDGVLKSSDWDPWNPWNPNKPDFLLLFGGGDAAVPHNPPAVEDANFGPCNAANQYPLWLRLRSGT